MKYQKMMVGVMLGILLLAGCSKPPIQSSLQEDTETSGGNQEVGDGDADSQEESEVSEDPSTMAGKVVVIQASALNVRDSAGLSGSVIGSLKQNDKATVNEWEEGTDGFDWYKVESGDVKGWIAGWFTIPEDDLNQHRGKENLLYAFDGHLESSRVTVEGSREDIEAALGTSYDEQYFNGGPFLDFGDTAYLLYGSGYPGKEEGDIAYIFYRGSGVMYGTSVGMTEEELRGVLGKPDRESVYEDESGEGLYEDGALILEYFTGSYEVIFVIGKESTLEQIQLAELEF